MNGLIVPFYAQAVEWTFVKDGVTYRPALVGSDGRLEVRAFGLDGATQRQVLVDAGGRLIVAPDVGAGDPRFANENYAAAQTNNELIAAPGSGKYIYLTGIFFSTDSAMNVKLTQSSGTPADVWGPHYFAANGGISAPELRPYIKLNDNSALRVTSSAAGNHTITVLALVV
ncbi:MAG TPA: hypothetical protein DCQ64_21025 [Candidatus Rokubacteria bacterium]|nr:hypothetical protein [Candidatus Rokubacteria bacterium]